MRPLDAGMVQECKNIASHGLAAVSGGIVRLGALAMTAIVEREAAQTLGRDGIVPAHAFPVLVAVGREAVHQHDRLAGVCGTEFVVGEGKPVGRELSHDFP